MWIWRHLGVHNCVSGEHSEDILIFHHFHEIGICYVFHGQNAKRVLWHHKSIVFVVSVHDNRAAVAGLVGHCLQTPCDNQQRMLPNVIFVFWHFPFVI